MQFNGRLRRVCYYYDSATFNRANDNDRMKTLDLRLWWKIRVRVGRGRPTTLVDSTRIHVAEIIPPVNVFVQHITYSCATISFKRLCIVFVYFFFFAPFALDFFRRPSTYNTRYCSAREAHVCS